MKKHTYRTKNVNQINWPVLGGDAVILAVDVAKGQQFALLTTQDGAVSQLLQWPLFETSPLIDGLKQLSGPVDGAMEATGTYGDALRQQFKKAGFGLYHIHAKQVNDAKAVYDGVARLHDAKSTHLNARLHRQGCTRPWLGPDDAARELSAAQMRNPPRPVRPQP
jgi:transposase